MTFVSTKKKIGKQTYNVDFNIFLETFNTCNNNKVGNAIEFTKRLIY